MNARSWLAVAGLAFLAMAIPAAAHDGDDHRQTERLAGTVVDSDPGRFVLRTASGGREQVRLTRSTRFVPRADGASLVPGRRVAVEVRRASGALVATEVRLDVLEPPPSVSTPDRGSAAAADSDFDAEDERLERPRDGSSYHCRAAYREGYRDGRRSALDARWHRDDTHPYAGLDDEDEEWEEWDDGHADHDSSPPP